MKTNILPVFGYRTVLVFVFVIPTLLCGTGGFACIPSPAGLVGWWEGEGDTHNVVSLDAGIATGTLSYGSGLKGEAFEFDGATARIHVPASAAINVGTSSGFTVELWVNPSDVTVPRPICQWNYTQPGVPASFFGPSIWISVGSGNGGTGVGSILFDVKEQGQNAHHIVCSAPGVVLPESWQHIAVTYDKLVGTATIYLNGISIAQTNVGTLNPETSQDLWVGYERNQIGGDLFRSIGGEVWYAGSMDEISLYNQALGGSDIQAIFQAGISGKCSVGPNGVTINPWSLSVAEGGEGTFSTLASGSSPIAYQWRFGGIALVGATNRLLELTNVQTSDAGLYDVIVANASGSITSTPAVLNVLPAYAPTWKLTAAPTNHQWTSVACSADGKKIVAASYDGCIYTSPDFGVTWISNSLPRLTWYSVASSFDGEKLVVGSVTLASVGAPAGAIFTSTNGGASWTMSATNISCWRVSSSADGNRLASIRYPYIYTSADAGGSWIKSGAPFLNWWSLTSSADGQKLVAASSSAHQVYTSTNAGTWWTLSTVPNSNAWQSVACSSDGNRLIAAAIDTTNSAGGPVFYSTNAGDTWLISGASKQRWIAVACSADGAKLVGAVTGGYLFVSTDGGTIWQTTRAPLTDWTCVASSGDATKLVAASWTGKIYTWEPTSLDLNLANGSVFVSWQTNVPGFILQSHVSAAGSNWINVTNQPIVIGDRYEIVIPLISDGQLFRLMYP